MTNEPRQRLHSLRSSADLSNATGLIRSHGALERATKACKGSLLFGLVDRLANMFKNASSLRRKSELVRCAS